MDAPENTLAAFRLARKNGAVAVEIDVSFTKDGHAVLMHDDTVDRTTDGHGRLDELTLDELKTLNAAHGHRLESEFDGVRVPTLDEAIEECLHLGLKIIFDVKGNAAQVFATRLQILAKRILIIYSSLFLFLWPLIRNMIFMGRPSLHLLILMCCTK